MWLCHTKFPSLGLDWAAPRDMSGSYGLTEVECHPVTFSGGTYGPVSMVRALQRIWDALIDL